MIAVSSGQDTMQVMSCVTEQQLRRWVSADRLRKYQEHPADTVELYMYNSELASHMSEVILHVEVLVRNVIHRMLSEASTSRGRPWYLDGKTYQFDRRMSAALAEAVRKAGGRDAAQGSVVAEIQFGTWRFLLSKQYQATVWPIVAPGFQGRPRSRRRRGELYGAMAYLNGIRNRCSHSEPVYRQNLDKFGANLSTAADFVERDAAQWIRDTWILRRQGCAMPEATP